MESELFEALYKEHYLPIVYRQCLRMLGNKEEAEDAANTVFLKLYKQEKTIDNPIHWLRRVTNNLGKNLIKRRRRELNMTYSAATTISLRRIREKDAGELWGLLGINKAENHNFISDTSYNRQFEKIEVQELISALMNETDEKTRSIIYLRYYDDMTLERIGEVVGLKKSAVEKRVKIFINLACKKYDKDKIVGKPLVRRAIDFYKDEQTANIAKCAAEEQAAIRKQQKDNI